MDRFLRERLTRHLNRRSQRAYRPPEGESTDAHLHRLGLQALQATRRRPHVHAFESSDMGKPDAGNLHVRFEEGGGG